MSTAARQPMNLFRMASTSRPDYAALRIVFSIVLLADVAHLFAHRALFLTTGLWPWFPVGPISLLWMAALALLAAGWQTSIAAVVNWLCCAIMLGLVAPNNGFQQAACDSVTIGISFLLLIVPRMSATSARWLLAAYLSSIYVDSAIHKLFSPMWSGGFGVLAPMTLPSLVWTDTSWASELPKWFWHAAGYGVCGFELLFPVLYAWRRTRLIALFTGIGMHAGIGIIYPIPVFAGIMLSLYAALLVPEILYGTQTAPVPWNRRTAVVLGVWGLAILNFYYPPLKALRKVVYMGAGIASHAVFENASFLRYAYQIRLVTPTGLIVPYSRGNLVGFDVRDRVWEWWWKRTQAPPVTMKEAETHMAVWAPDSRIEARPQSVELDQINPGLFRDNDHVAWLEVGRIDNGSVHWNRPPEDPRQKLGDYMASILR
jgi:hypothetical protein